MEAIRNALDSDYLLDGNVIRKKMGGDAVYIIDNYNVIRKAIGGDAVYIIDQYNQIRKAIGGDAVYRIV